MQLSHLDNYFMLKWVIKVINIQGDFCLINNVHGDILQPGGQLETPGLVITELCFVSWGSTSGISCIISV